MREGGQIKTLTCVDSLQNNVVRKLCQDVVDMPCPRVCMDDIGGGENRMDRLQDPEFFLQMQRCRPSQSSVRGKAIAGSVWMCLPVFRGGSTKLNTLNMLMPNGTISDCLRVSQPLV